MPAARVSLIISALPHAYMLCRFRHISRCAFHADTPPPLLRRFDALMLLPSPLMLLQLYAITPPRGACAQRAKEARCRARHATLRVNMRAARYARCSAAIIVCFCCFFAMMLMLRAADAMPPLSFATLAII